MTGLLPAAVYGLEVPTGDIMIAAVPDFPASFRITMAAIDPSAAPEYAGTTIDGSTPRATLRLIRQPIGMDVDDSEDGSELDEKYLEGLLGNDSDEISSDEEANGGPSDRSKLMENLAADKIKQSLAHTVTESDDEMNEDLPNGINGAVSKINKGKGKATGNEDDEDEDDSEDIEVEEFVLCTLDPEKHYQQTLDITIGEDERVFFKVFGTHSVFLTGNYVIPVDNSHDHDDDEDDGEYDLSPDEDELNDEESDELDTLEDPRITELESDDEVEAPKLTVKKETKKGKNKRSAADSDDEPATLDDIMAKSIKPAEPVQNGEPKLSKKQLKKLKNNAGKAVAASEATKSAKKVDQSSNDNPKDKKVQFAKNLEQGPSGAATESKAKSKKEDKKDMEKPKATSNIRTVQGVKIDDRTPGKGPAAKKGDKVGMRYIGKLQDGKQFDANKKGPPFTFTIGKGEVIKGWDIGVEGLSVGGERRITVPASLGYGSKAIPGIPANSVLIFDLKLLEIK